MVDIPQTWAEARKLAKEKNFPITENLKEFIGQHTLNLESTLKPSQIQAIVDAITVAGDICQHASDETKCAETGCVDGIITVTYCRSGQCNGSAIFIRC